MARKLVLGLLKKMKFLPAPLYMKIYYEYYTGKRLNLKNPLEFNAKIQWLKTYYHVPILHQLVDKYAVREYVTEKIGAKYLNELIKVYEHPKEVDFDELPNAFALKAVHGYNFNLIVPDKTKLNRIKAHLLMRKWVSKNQYKRGGLEWAYKGVKPRIIVEKYLSELGKTDIDDYKFFCFNGSPKFIQVDIDRGTSHKRSYYDIDWTKLPFNNKGYKPIKDDLPKPKNFSKMLELCRKLAASFPFVRVDLYNLDGHILFGEMTFYPGDGRLELVPDKFNRITGDYMKLPKIPSNQDVITTFQT